MLPSLPRIVQPSDKQTTDNGSSTPRKLLKTVGKNFLVDFMAHAEKNNTKRVLEARPQNSKETASRKERKTEYSENSANQDSSKIHDVVNEMGLSYYFVLQDDHQNDLPMNSHVTDIEQQTGLTMDFKEASQMLAKLGFFADEILSLQGEVAESGKIALEKLLNFLNNRAPVQQTTAIKGDDLSKILSGISLSGNSLHFSIDSEKEFSLTEIKHILSRVGNMPQESGDNLADVALQKPSEAVISSDISSFQGTGKEGQQEVYQKDLKDAFARTITSEDKSALVRPDQDQYDQTHDYQKGLKNILNKVVEQNPSNQTNLVSLEYASKSIAPSPRPDTENVQRTAGFVGNIQASQQAVSLAKNIQDTAESDDALFKSIITEKGVEIQTAVTQISPDTFSGSGDNKFFQNPFSGQQPELNFIRADALQTFLVDGGQNFGQILAKSHIQSSAPHQILSQSVIASQLAEHIQQMRQEGQNRLILQLEPMELGRIVVKLSARDQKISTHITAENDEVKDLLQKNSRDLRQYLEEQGLSLEEFYVEADNSRGNTSGQHDSSKNAYSGNAPNSASLVPGVVSTLGASGWNNVSTTGHLIYFYA